LLTFSPLPLHFLFFVALVRGRVVADRMRVDSDVDD
jgi:hypothetical protein